MNAHPALDPAQLTLGVLAGGRASRLGGRDKAWLRCDGEPQILRWHRCLSGQAHTFLVSANRSLPRYALQSLRVVPDRSPDAGPLSGLDALAAVTSTPWLLTLPVDLRHVPDDLVLRLAREAGTHGACAHDSDGPQPLVALWPVPALRRAATGALATQRFGIQALQRELGMQAVAFDAVRFGNLNTQEDLDDAGIDRD